MKTTLNEATYQLTEVADSMLQSVRNKLFEAADCERNAGSRITSLDHAMEILRELTKEIERARKEVASMNPQCPKCGKGPLAIGGAMHLRHYDYFFHCDWCSFIWPERCGFDSSNEVLKRWNEVHSTQTQQTK